MHEVWAHDKEELKEKFINQEFITKSMYVCKLKNLKTRFSFYKYEF